MQTLWKLSNIQNEIRRMIARLTQYRPSLPSLLTWKECINLIDEAETFPSHQTGGTIQCASSPRATLATLASALLTALMFDSIALVAK